MACSKFPMLSELYSQRGGVGREYLYYSPSFQRHIALVEVNRSVNVLESFAFLDDAKESYPNATLLPISEDSGQVVVPRMAGGGLFEEIAYCPTSESSAVAKTCFSSGETLFKYKLVVSKLYETIISKIADNPTSLSVESAFLERFAPCDRHFVRERMLFFLSPQSTNISWCHDWPKSFSRGYGAGLTEKQAFDAIQALPHLLAINPIDSKRLRPPIPFLYQMGVPLNLIDMARTELDEFLMGVGIVDIASIAYLKSLDITWDQCRILLSAFPCLLTPSLEPSWEHTESGPVRSAFMEDSLYYLRSRLQLTPADIFAMIKTHSRLSGYTVQILKFHLDAMQSKLCLTSRNSQALVLRTPSLLGVSPSSLDERIDFMLSINMTLPQIREAVLKQPALLQYSVKKNLIPKVVYLQQSLHISDENLTKLVVSNPSILGRSLNRSVIPMVNGLARLCGVRHQDIGSMLVQVPALFGLSWETNLKPKASFLKQRLGLSQKQLQSLLLSTPRVLVHSIDGSLEPKLKLLEASATRKGVSSTVISNPSILLTNKDILQKKLDLNRRNNITVEDAFAPQNSKSGPVLRQKKPVMEYSMDGELTQSFLNVQMAANAAGTTVTNMYSIIRRSRIFKEKKYIYGSLDEPSTIFVGMDGSVNSSEEFVPGSPAGELETNQLEVNSGFMKNLRRSYIPQDGNFRLADALKLNSTNDQNKLIITVVSAGRSHPPERRDSVRGRRRAGGLALHFPQVDGFYFGKALRAAAESLLGGQVMPPCENGTTYCDGVVLIGYPYLRPSRNRCSLYACRDALRLVQNLLAIQRSACPEFENATVTVEVFTDSIYAWSLIRNTTRLLQWGSFSRKEDFYNDGEGPEYSANLDILYPVARTYYRLVQQEFLPAKGVENPLPQLAKEVKVRFRHISEARQDAGESPMDPTATKIGEFAARAAEWQYERARRAFQ